MYKFCYRIVAFCNLVQKLIFFKQICSKNIHCSSFIYVEIILQEIMPRIVFFGLDFALIV